jgi:hypothetical protein
MHNDNTVLQNIFPPCVIYEHFRSGVSAQLPSDYFFKRKRVPNPPPLRSVGAATGVDGLTGPTGAEGAGGEGEG